MENIFTKPEKPFLLIYTDTDDMVSYTWLETEEDLLEVIEEIKGYGCTIVDAIEINSCRDVKIGERVHKFETALKTDVIMDISNNLMKCPHCGEIIGNTSDWTPNYCCECGKPLSGGNGKAP